VGTTLAYSYWDKDVSGVLVTATGGGSIEVVGRTTVEMGNQSNYTNWDFNNVWIMGIDGYPKLRWQN
jgi:hypothetical protein